MNEPKSCDDRSPLHVVCPIFLAETEVVTNQQANLWSMRGVFYVIVASLALSALCVLAEWLVAASRDARSSRRAVKVSAISCGVGLLFGFTQSWQHRVLGDPTRLRTRNEMWTENGNKGETVPVPLVVFW